MSNYKFETLQLHAGQETADTVTNSRAVPIYQTTSYVFDSVDHAKNLFSLKEAGNIYSRMMNPTTDVLEKRITALDGGIGAVAVSSGSAAITYAILNLAVSGDEVISSKNLYGGTYNLFANTIKDMGINVKFYDPDKPEEIEKLVNKKTKAVFIESIGNPNADITDIQKTADISHKYGLPLIVDNTFAPYLCKPFDHGADLIVYSATKFLGGHGTTIAGLVVDKGDFDWKNERFDNFNKPDPGYNNLKYADLGEAAYIIKLRVKLLRDTGACLSPFNSFLILQGIETLSLRIERHVQNALKTAEYLESYPKIKVVNYPGLEGSRYKKLQEKYLPYGGGSIFTFELEGGLEAGKKFISSLKLFSHLANVADAKSLIIHPASTTHSQLSEAELKACNINLGTIRISIGLENIEDIINDLKQALDKI